MTYTRAIEPSPGDPVTSRVVRSHARAANDRLRLGPSVPWRMVQLCLSAFTAIRNPDASRFLFPSLGEFFEFYQMLDPRDAQWPETGPGDPEGTNLANQMANFVFGADAVEVPPEADRLGDPAEGGLNLNAHQGTPAELWQLAKEQRGALDPVKGGLSCPAWYAAGRHTELRQSPTSRAGGFTFGDYLPGPAVSGLCAGLPEDQIIYNQTFKFTRLHDPGTVVTFPSCPDVDGAAAGVVHAPFYYAVFLWDGTIRVFPKTEWLEGPYDANPTLRRAANGMVERALAQFVRDFRGTAAQRASGEWNEFAFQLQEFLTTQYHLAPQRGYEVGEYVVPIYPRFGVKPPAGLLPAGLPLPLAHASLGKVHRIADGFVCASMYAGAIGLSGSTRVTLYRDGVALGVAELTADADGNAETLVTFNRPVAGGTITAVLTDAAAFVGDTRELLVEITELQAYKPSLIDCYLLLRVGGVDFEAKVDGSGEDCTFAAEISKHYFRDGVIRSLGGHIALPGSLDVINTNAVFDAARRLSQVVRIMPRLNFRGIAVQGGKTILWFDRWARGMSHDTPIDLFGGIAPAPKPIASGRLVWGRRYKVAQGAITYQKRGYTAGQIFTAVQDEPKFTGRGVVYEADGVYDAPPAGWSNRWLMGLRLCQYNPNEASLWKPEVFADYYPLHNRCLFGDPAAAYDPATRAHISFGEIPSSLGKFAMVTPEAPDSYNYVPTLGAAEAGFTNANQLACTEGDTDCEARRKNFYTSCRMFEPWPEAESVELDGDEIKVTLPFFHHDPARDGGDFSRDHTTWDLAALRAEPYRTWRNALREYQLWASTGLNSSLKTGDEAGNSLVRSEMLDLPYGAIFPSFHWVKLVPEPYEDGNDDPDEADTPLVHDPYPHLDLVLRAACEGYVDGRLTTEVACNFDAETDLYSFTWENLNFAADGGRGIPVLPTKATELIEAADTRPDQPEFFGPMPNVVVSAETAAGVARRLNLLTTFRVLLPLKLQYRYGYATGSADATSQVRNSRDELAAASGDWTFGSAQYAVYYEGSTPGVGGYTYDDWSDYTGSLGASNGRSLSVNRLTSPLTATIDASKTVIEFRWNGPGDILETLPPAIRSQLSLSPYFVAKLSNIYDSFEARSHVVGATSGSQCSSPTHGPDTVWSDGRGGATRFTALYRDYPDQCRPITNGSITPGPIPERVVFLSSDAQSGLGGPPCHGDCFSAIHIAINTTTTPSVHVPLVDLAD
jgi:hypothetical protein